MQYLDLTYPTPQENLACDETLLDLCESGHRPSVLRFWEPRQPFIVLGYSNKYTQEIIVDTCRQLNIPILRRISGGGTILQGSGCLNYSLILNITESKELTNITRTNAFIMNTHKSVLESLLHQPVQVQGHTDLTIHNLKFSGNSQKRKKHALLFHGTFLLDFDISFLDKILHLPHKQPTYRQHRSHSDFLTNIHLPAELIKQSLQHVWQATTPAPPIPMDNITHLVSTKYSLDSWNLRT